MSERERKVGIGYAAPCFVLLFCHFHSVFLSWFTRHVSVEVAEDMYSTSFPHSTAYEVGVHRCDSINEFKGSMSTQETVDLEALKLMFVIFSL